MREYYKMDKLLENINDLIVDSLGEYDTDKLNEIIVGLLQQHIFTSNDSIDSLIIYLEDLKEVNNE